MQSKSKLYFRGTSGKQIFPLRQTSEEPNQWASSLQHPGHSGGNYKGMNMINVVGSLTSETWMKRHEQIRRVHGIDGISPTLPTGTGGGVMTKIQVKPVLTPDRAEKRQNGRRFKDDGEEMFTLTGQDIHGVMKGNRIRRLTPIECERLQGFPDNWTRVIMAGREGEYIKDKEGFLQPTVKYMSDTQRYKQCGNAVTVNVIEAIMRKLIKCFV